MVVVDPRDRVVGVRILAGQPAWIQIDVVGRPDLGGRPVTDQAGHKGDLGGPGQAMRGGQHQVAARRMQHRAGAHVLGATVQKDCADASVGIHRPRDRPLLPLTEVLCRPAVADWRRGNWGGVRRRPAARRHERQQADQRAQQHHRDPHRLLSCPTTGSLAEFNASHCLNGFAGRRGWAGKFSANELDPGLHAFRLLVPVDLGETG